MRLLQLNFEQSTKLVSKQVLTEKGASIGIAASMRFKDRIIIFLINCFFFIPLLLNLGIALPKLLVANPDANHLPVHVMLLIGQMGIVFKPLLLSFICGLLLLCTFNLLPKRHYASQLLWGNLIVFFLVAATLLTAMPLIIGLALDGTGLLGIIVQIVFGGYILSLLVQRMRGQLFKRVLGSSGVIDRDFRPIWQRLKWIGIISFGLVMLNRYTLQIGELSPTKPVL